MRPLGDEGDACQSKKCAHVSDGRRSASPRCDLAPDYVRMSIGE